MDKNVNEEVEQIDEVSDITPRQILLDHFGLSLPIQGGWGYTKKDACIIDRNDPSVSQVLPFDGLDIEYVFVEKRIFEELIVMRPKDDAFWGIEWELQKQRHTIDVGKHYDCLTFNISAFSARSSQAKGSTTMGYGSKERVHITREFWFDITSFIGVS